MSPTSSNCMKSIHHDHQPLNLANKNFEESQIIYIYIYSDTQQATHARNRFGQSISSINPSVHASCIHISCRSILPQDRSNRAMWLVDCIHWLAIISLSCVGSNAWFPRIHLHACITSQDRSNSAMDIELRYWVSSFKKCARASVRSTPRNPCVTRQYIIYIETMNIMREIQWKDVRGKGPKSHVPRSWTLIIYIVTCIQKLKYDRELHDL